jgi:hypothetical protein
MARTVLACVVTAGFCFAVTATTGFASRGGTIIRAGNAAWFPVSDVWCVAELASGAPRFKEPGVACSSYRQPYKGHGVWIGSHRIVITSPPSGRAIYSVRR